MFQLTPLRNVRWRLLGASIPSHIRATRIILLVVLIITLSISYTYMHSKHISRRENADDKDKLRGVTLPLYAPLRVVQPLFWEARLCVNVIHSNAFRQKLLSLLFPHIAETDYTVIIVGVEYGKDFLFFCEMGSVVHGVEALEKFSKALGPFEVKNRCKIHNVALSDGNKDTMEVNYSGTKGNAKAMPLDSLFARSIEKIHLLTVDTGGRDGGNEFEVLSGGTKIVGKASVIFVEISACSPSNLKLLDLLHSHGFILFDHIWYGLPNNEHVLNKTRISQHELKYDRPLDFESYVRDFCFRKEQSYQFLQTDIIAIRNAKVTSSVFSLLGLAMNHCKSFPCPIRNFQFI